MFKRLFARNSGNATTNHAFDDLDRVKAKESRQRNTILRQEREKLAFDRQMMMLQKEQLELEKQRLELKELQEDVQDMQYDYYEDDNDEQMQPEDMVMMRLLDVFTGKLGLQPQQQQQPQPPQQPADDKVTLNDDEINALMERHKNELPKLKKLNEQQLQFIIRMNYPTLSEKTIMRAMEMIKQ